MLTSFLPPKSTRVGSTGLCGVFGLRDPPGGRHQSHAGSVGKGGMAREWTALSFAGYLATSRFELWEQRATGARKGTSLDSTGIIVPVATVIVMNSETKVENKTTATSAGAYLFAVHSAWNLRPRLYRARVPQGTRRKRRLARGADHDREDHDRGRPGHRADNVEIHSSAARSGHYESR